MGRRKSFRDRNAGRYDRFMRKDAAAYERLFKLLRPVVRRKTVLELATGTGLIAKNIVSSAAHIEATDASGEMIAQAKRDSRSAKLHFSLQDMFHPPYADGEDIIYRDIETEVECKMLKKAINQLPERERIIVDLRFGLSSEDGEEKTQKEVADMLGISQSYISRLEKKIMRHIQCLQVNCLVS